MTTVPFGSGYACLDEETDVILGFRTNTDSQRNYLLTPDVYWHTIEHYWGAGYISTNVGADKWNVPEQLCSNNAQQPVSCAQFNLHHAGLQLTRTRMIRDHTALIERYVWENITDQPVSIDLLSIQTPWNDWYPGGMKALNENINAHIYTAGTQSWVLAEPMSGISQQSPALGMIVHEGALYSYSIESRTEITGSNTRGHIVLNVTDYARNAEAMGGQPCITLQPGEQYVLAWELGWYSSRDEFMQATQPLAACNRYAQHIGESIRLQVNARRYESDHMCGKVHQQAVYKDRTCTTAETQTKQDNSTAYDQIDIVCIAANEPALAHGRRPSGGVLEQPSVQDLHIAACDHSGCWEITAHRLGSYIIEIRTHDDVHHIHRTQRMELLFHDTLEHTVQHVSTYILQHHIAEDRPGLLAAGIVPVDTRTGLRVDDGGWPDWTDGSERISMAILLTKALRCGWIGTAEHCPRAREAVEQWREFALQYLVDGTAATRRGSSQPVETFGDRIYDVPWLTEFFCDHYELTHNNDDLDIGVRLLERMADLGAEHFLAIGYSEISVRLAKLLRAVGRNYEAHLLEQHVVASAQHFLSLGRDLPDHEVAYEQSITAPLVNLMIEGYRLTQDTQFIPAIQETLQWLLAFGGPQPSVRLYAIGLRHWDGHWFGIGKQFGDVFPHYWTMLTATALARLPQPLRTPHTDALAHAIAYANLANINSDGSGTCAFMYPSSIDGQAQSQPDPMSNDQYWHLALWMRLIDEEGFTAQ